MVVWKNRGGFYSQTSQKHFSKKCPKISVLDAFNPNFGPPVFQDTFGLLVLSSFDAAEFGTERYGGHRRGVWVRKFRRKKDFRDTWGADMVPFFSWNWER